MNIIFRVDASSLIGSGHVMRCLTLADALRAYGVQSYFICRLHSGNMVSFIESKGYKVLSLPAPSDDWILSSNDNQVEYSSWLGESASIDAAQTIAAIDKLHLNCLPEWCIIDHYAIDTKWENTIKPFCLKLMVIDDLANRRHNCDILLDQTFERSTLDYQPLVSGNCTLLTGSQYALLRPEFLAWRGYSLKRRHTPTLRNILITLGGVDNDNITSKVLLNLKKSSLPSSSRITVVMGISAPYLAEVQKIAKSMPCSCEIKVDVPNMAQLMTNSDLCIGAAGSTTWERCCLGLPTILIILASNQNTIAQALNKKGAVILPDNLEELPTLIKNISKNTYDLSKLTQASSEICDGKGIKRVLKSFDIVRKDFKTNKTGAGSIRKMTKDDLDMVLSWRNHINVRRVMHTQHKISPKEHKHWFHKTSTDPQQHLLIFENNSLPQGFIKFTNTKSKGVFDWGFYLAPHAPKGMGRKLGNSALFFAFTVLKFDKVCGQVLSFNKRSVKFHISLGFLIEEVSNPQLTDKRESYSLIDFELCKNDWKKNQEFSYAK